MPYLFITIFYCHRAMTHQITIGADHVCDHCILKLTKEANEWRDEMDGAKTGDEFWMGYVFWSCADVTIVGSDTGRVKLLSH